MLAGIAVGALLGLAPALVFRALIDHLAGERPEFGHVLLLVGAGIGAAILAGLIGLADDYLTERISQGIIFDLREQPVGADGGRAVLLPGDLDGLDDLMERGVDLAADWLVFPHHGGHVADADDTEFAVRLCEAVRLQTVVFSHSRTKYFNPVASRCGGRGKRCQRRADRVHPAVAQLRDPTSGR